MEEQCRQEMEKHKQMLDREYEQLLTQFSRELERLQLKHQEELGKRVRPRFYLLPLKSKIVKYLPYSLHQQRYL